jgi:hypothetical protein
VVVDPASNQMYYFNGATHASSGLQGGATTVFPLNQLNDTYGVIGRSLYGVDSTLAASISEFRIYSSVLSVSNIVLNDAAGPNSIVTSTGGAITAIQLASPVNPMIIGQVSQQLLSGDFPNVNGVNLIAYGTNGGVAATFTSANTAVFSVNSSTKSIFISSSTLYPFTNNFAEADGHYDGTPKNGASIRNDFERGSVLNLAGIAKQYVNLPAGVRAAETIAGWVKWSGGNSWQRIFDFGLDTNQFFLFNNGRRK